MADYRSGTGLLDTWANLLLIDLQADYDPVIWCADVCQTAIMMEVYLKNFRSNGFIKHAKVKKGYCEYNRAAIDEFIYKHKTIFLDRLKVSKKPSGHITYSLANATKTRKGMDENMLEEMQTILSNFDNIGDSRNFESVEELDSKFKRLLNCKMHIGSETSWYVLCTRLQIPCMNLFQMYPYKSLKRVTINDVKYNVEPHMLIGDKHT